MASTNYPSSAAGGGFIPPSPSPAPSSSTTTTTTTLTPRLPQQRKHPLRPGSAKETAVINFVDSHILAINRRHAKKFSSAFADENDDDGGGGGGGGGRGYESFKEVARDVEAIVDVLWVSGTPSLQIPYLISLAGLVSTYLPDFPFAARATFGLIRKLDVIFASLLVGEDLETGEPLAGFSNGNNGGNGGGGGGVVSMTEKVRIKSIAESARVVIVSVQGRGEGDDEDEEDEDEDEDDDEGGDGYGNGYGGGGGGEFGEELGRWETESGRVYERTIQLLGDELGKQDG
ncbi:hypothetical protein FQN52_007180 [Onygenales sp. PD_12]|nr:hypothetical protein FQN52_007180 [Onygenales sp. PD_12]